MKKFTSVLFIVCLLISTLKFLNFRKSQSKDIYTIKHRSYISFSNLQYKEKKENFTHQLDKVNSYSKRKKEINISYLNKEPYLFLEWKRTYEEERCSMTRKTSLLTVNS